MVCGGLRWFSRFLRAHGHTDVYGIIVPNSGGGLWWFAVVCGGLRWFVVDCGGLSFSHTVVPVMNGHPRDQAKVSVHCRWPLVTGTDGQVGDAKYNTHCNNT